MLYELNTMHINVLKLYNDVKRKNINYMQYEPDMLHEVSLIIIN